MGAHTGFHVGPEALTNPLSLFFLQIIIIWAVGWALGAVFRRLKQPVVIAQIITGIMLGPTAVGAIPGWLPNMFPSWSLPAIQMTGQVGLIFYVFMVGLELDLAILKKIGPRPIVVASCSMVMGVSIAVPLAFLFNDPQYYTANMSSFIFFMGVVLGISALPVMARIVTERGLAGTPFANYLMACKVVNDLEAWPLLSISIMAYAGDVKTMLYMIPVIIGDIVIVFFVLKPLMAKLTSYVEDCNELPQWYLLAVTSILFSFAFLTEICGVTAIVGAVEMGFIMPRQYPRALRLLLHKIEDFVVVVLLPIYFAYSGLRTNVLQLSDGAAWGWTALIIVAAFTTMLIGAGLTSYLMGLPGRDSLALGVMMTTKGLVGLIALNYGLDSQIITVKLFSMCVIMAIFTTAFVVPFINMFKSNASITKAEFEAAAAAELELTSTDALDNACQQVALVSCAPTHSYQVWAAARLLTTAAQQFTCWRAPGSVHVQVIDDERPTPAVITLSEAISAKALAANAASSPVRALVVAEHGDCPTHELLSALRDSLNAAPKPFLLVVVPRNFESVAPASSVVMRGASDDQDLEPLLAALKVTGMEPTITSMASENADGVLFWPADTPLPDHLSGATVLLYACFSNSPVPVVPDNVALLEPTASATEPQ